MKRIILLFVIVVMISGISFCQDYQPVKTDTVYYFSNKDNTLKAIRIDSIKDFGNYRKLYNYSTVEIYGGNHMCLGLKGESWIGRQIIEFKNGLWVFLNNSNDSIRLYPKAEKGFKWTLFKYPDNSYIEAIIEDIKVQQILGSNDSVKVISLQTKNYANNNIENDLNNEKILLSRKFGLIRLLSFFYYPNRNTNNVPVVFYDIAGYGNVGVKNISLKDVYNFDVGDEFHYFKYEDSQTYKSKIIEEVKKKEYSDNNDTVKYLFSIIKKTDHYEMYFDGQIKYRYINTMYSNYDEERKYMLSDCRYYLPDERITVDFNTINYYSCSINQYGGKQVLRLNATENLKDTCAGSVADNSIIDDYYIEGCGVYNHEWGLMGEPIWEKLEYYKKKNSIWGTPYDRNEITGIGKKDYENKEVNLYYSDGKFIANINSKKPCNLEIFQTDGKIVFEKRINSGENVISNLNIHKCLYLYRIYDNEGFMKCGKIFLP